MPNNFRRHLELGLDPATCAFVSKSGLDSNDGLTPDTPKRTLAAAYQTSRLNIMVGGDVYVNEQFTADRPAGIDANFYADGACVLKGDVGKTLTGNLGRNVKFYDFTIFGYETLVNRGNTTQTATLFYRCYISKGAALVRGYTAVLFYDCVLRGVTARQDGNLEDQWAVLNGVYLSNCVAVGCALRVTSGFLLNYCDETTTLTLQGSMFLQPGGGINTGNRANNIRCGFKFSISKSLAEADVPFFTSLADQQQIGAAYLPDCINQPPKFNRPEKDDFTLQLSSPHLNSGIGPSHLRLSSAWLVETDASPGEDVTLSNTRLRSVANPSYFIVPLAVSNLIVNAQGGLEVKPNSLGNAEGSITWAPRRIADTPAEINYYNFTAGLNFNADFLSDPANPSPYNSSVPDYSNYTAGSAGRNPNRLAEQWRWSRNAAPDPANASDWVSGAAFLEFQLFAAPWFNPATLRGTGDPLFDWNATRELPTATFVQSRWKLRQDRSI